MDLIRPLLVAAALLPVLSCQSAFQRSAEESYVKGQGEALLHYRKIGTGEDVIVVPGACWLSPDLDWLAKGHTVIYYDLRHRGRSGKASVTNYEEDLEDLELVLDWFNVERATLLGADYQAALIANFAALHPDRVEKLVLVSPVPIRKDPYWIIYDRMRNERSDHAAFERLRELVKKGGQRVHPNEWAEAYKDMILSGMVADPSSLDRMKASFVVEPNLDPAPLYRQYMDLLRKLGDWDWRGDVGGVGVPTLVVYGSEDPIPARANAEWVESISGAREVVLQGSGRLGWIEKPRAFEGAVKEFVGGY